MSVTTSPSPPLQNPFPPCPALLPLLHPPSPLILTDSSLHGMQCIPHLLFIHPLIPPPTSPLPRRGIHAYQCSTPRPFRLKNFKQAALWTFVWGQPLASVYGTQVGKCEGRLNTLTYDTNISAYLNNGVRATLLWGICGDAFRRRLIMRWEVGHSHVRHQHLRLPGQRGEGRRVMGHLW